MNGSAPTHGTLPLASVLAEREQESSGLAWSTGIAALSRVVSIVSITIAVLA